MAIFATADHQLGDGRFDLLQRPFCTPQEMTDFYVARHNSVVTPGDLVYFVGDVVYQETPQCVEQVARFHGRKILLRGNHDRCLTDSQLLRYFDAVIPEGKGLDIMVGDIPCHLNHYPSQARHGRFNLVGHVHGAWKVQLNCLNVGVDVHHRPVRLDKAVPFFLKAVTEFYDDDVWAGYLSSNNSYRERRGKRGSYFRPAKVRSSD